MIPRACRAAGLLQIKTGKSLRGATRDEISQRLFSLGRNLFGDAEPAYKNSRRQDGISKAGLTL
jgi:hypothetical protein